MVVERNCSGERSFAGGLLVATSLLSSWLARTLRGRVKDKSWLQSCGDFGVAWCLRYCRWSRVAEFGTVVNAETIKVVAKALLRQRKIIVAKGRGRSSAVVLR